MQQVPWLKHHPQLRGCELRPHLIRDAGGLLSPFHMEGGQQGQEHWESTPRHPIHPPTPPAPSSQLLFPSTSPSPCTTPRPQHLPPLLLLLSTHTRGEIFPAWAQPTSSKKGHLEGLKQQEKPPVSQGGLQKPLAPWHPRGQGPLTLILCRRHLGLSAVSCRLAAIRSQVLLGFHENRSLGGGGRKLFIPAISAGHAEERGGEGN